VWTCEWSNGEDADFFGCGGCVDDREVKGLERGGVLAGLKKCVFPDSVEDERAADP
jgi:hypothetical protein